MKTLLFILILISSPLPGFQPGEKKGIVYFSRDQGLTWENGSQGLPVDIVLTDIATGNNFLGVSTKQKGIFVFDFQTRRWNGVAGKAEASSDIDALYFHHGKMFAGTHGDGIFVSSDQGRNWSSSNGGLKNLTIRKFMAMGNVLFAGTNGGLFRLDERTERWSQVFGKPDLQVNGIKEFGGEIYLGTNQGVFKANRQGRGWKQVMADRSLHNIGSANGDVYALTYNELFLSSDKGLTWRSDQKGMPAGKYTFHVVEQHQTVLAGQWDGVYVKTSSGWNLASKGLPANFAVVELAAFDGIIVAASSAWAAE